MQVLQNCDNCDLLCKTNARLTQCSKPFKKEKKPFFFNLLVQISGRIWTVVGSGYFLLDSSHSENVASAHRVLLFDIYLFTYVLLLIIIYVLYFLFERNFFNYIGKD